ncbi:MAG: FtsX-like permease family protein [Gemmatimonadaceae bacterium]
MLRKWPNVDAIGKRIRKGVDPSINPWLTVVGIASSVKHTSLDEVGDLQLYEPFAQNPRWGSFLVVRAAGSPEGLTAACAPGSSELYPTLPLFDVHTMEQALDRSLGTKRLTNTLLTSFALIALLLAAIGIYGMMSLHVSARMKEFGIRPALGARPASVLGLVMREGLTLAVGGVVLGLAGAALLTHAPPKRVALRCAAA